MLTCCPCTTCSNLFNCFFLYQTLTAMQYIHHIRSEHTTNFRLNNYPKQEKWSAIAVPFILLSPMIKMSLVTWMIQVSLEVPSLHTTEQFQVLNDNCSQSFKHFEAARLLLKNNVKQTFLGNILSLASYISGRMILVCEHLVSSLIFI